jgi:Fe-S-cluster-containing hydrogenase component 2/CRP-like cAMP-binding protein
MKRKIDVSLIKKNADGMVHANLDGKDVVVEPGLTVWEAAIQQGTNIPALCHQDRLMPNTFVDLNPVGVCRLCCVDIGEKDPKTGKVRSGGVLAPSCMRPIEEGMVIKTRGGDIDVARKTLVELLMSDHPSPCEREQKQEGACELERWAKELGVGKPAFPARSREQVEVNKKGVAKNAVDHSNPAIRIDHAACVVCDRCVRACSDIRGNYVIGRMGKGAGTSISFDNNLLMDDSTCVNCGECMISCPTGAITYGLADQAEDAVVDSADDAFGGRGIVPEVKDLYADRIGIFKGISPEFLERSRRQIRVIQYKPGEVICRQGDFGSTAYYITGGSCKVYVDPKLNSSAKASRSDGLLGKLTKALMLRRDDGRADPSLEGRSIPGDASQELTYDKKLGRFVVDLKEGALFGEMACMTFQKRSATVVAGPEGVEVIEMLRNVLDLLRKNEAFRDRMDESYRKNALYGQLKRVPIFEGVDEKFLTQLEQKAELLRVRPDQKLFGEGDLADAFYVVRSGHIRVSTKRDWGEVTLNYLARGSVFGEIACLGVFGYLDPELPGGDGRRTATCVTLDNAELVRINANDLKELIDAYPQVRDRLLELARRNIQATAMTAPQYRPPPQTNGDANLESFIANGLYQAQSLLILDLENCTRCDECVKACAQAHDGIVRMVRDGPRFGKYLVATSCRSCYDPKCMVGCPVGSIRRKNNLEILIEDWCVGCGQCAKNCPYGSITMHDYEAVVNVDGDNGKTQKRTVARQKAAACDLSTELHEPACVYACPHDAAMRVDAQQFFKETLVNLRIPAKADA